MKTFYCVTSAIDDSGSVTAAITASVEAEAKPENTCCELPTKDIYIMTGLAHERKLLRS